MAYAYPTLLDIAKFRAADGDGLIEDNIDLAPELQLFPARSLDRDSFTGLYRTALPTGQFRNANEGVEPTKSTYDNKTFTMAYYDAQMECDAQVAARDNRGVDHVLMVEADGHVKSFVINAGKQIWYGTDTGGSSKGFPGAKQLVDDDYTLDVEGTTAGTGSSVYMVALGPNNCEVLIKDNSPITIDTWRKQTITRSSKELTAWKNSIEGLIGCAWYSKYAIARAYNITADNLKTCTDTVLANLKAKLPAAFKPTHIFMTARSAMQLRQSRTPVVLIGQGTGSSVLAPAPADFDGIPIVVTDSLLNTETLE